MLFPPIARFYMPHHLPDEHPERVRVRKGADLRQCFEQCDLEAHADRNPVSCVRGVTRVQCIWRDMSDINDVDRGDYDFWFKSGWDGQKLEVVPLNKCVDSKGYIFRAEEIYRPPGEAAQTRSARRAMNPSPRRQSPPKAAPKRALERLPPEDSGDDDDTPRPKKKRVSQAKDGDIPVDSRAQGGAARQQAPHRSAEPPSAEPELLPVEARKYPIAKASPAPILNFTVKAPALVDPQPPVATRTQQEAAEVMPSRKEMPQLGKAKAKKLPIGTAAEPATRFSTVIPKKAGGAALPGVAVGDNVADTYQADADAPQAKANHDPTANLSHWRSVRPTGGHPPQVLHVEGVPPYMELSCWKAALQAARVMCKFTALGGWCLPDGGWRCNGSAYLLCDHAKVNEVRRQLNGAVLKVPGETSMRPLTCSLCDLGSLLPPQNPPPLPGHFQLPAHAREGGSSRTASSNEVVPHFVQANTLELEFAIQWRALIAQHKLANEIMTKKHATELSLKLRTR